MYKIGLLLLGIVALSYGLKGCREPCDRSERNELRNKLERRAARLIDTIVLSNYSVYQERFPRLFAENASMCITARRDLGCYDGLDHILGYTALVDPNVGELIQYWSWRLYRSTVDTKERTVQFLTEWDFYSYQTGQNYTVTSHLYFSFDCDNKITYYAALSDNIVYVQAEMPPISDHNITRICQGGPRRPDLPYMSGIQEACVGEYQVYASIAECEAFLSSIPVENDAVPFGTGNSVGCRDWHLGMARVDPATHCSHVGPTGGGKCCDPGHCDHMM